METKSARFWDEWWQDRLSQEYDYFTFPYFESPIARDPRSLYWLVNGDDWLITVMSEIGLRTILCAGNGVSQEPRALAAAGFEVTALDISPAAISFAEAYEADPRLIGQFCSSKLRRPGGSVEFVVGDLLDGAVCPGPFDVVIERRTVQRFAEHERGAALSALADRLNGVGIFMSQCVDALPPELGWSQHRSGVFHASESWFREHGWMICDEIACAPVAERVAWLVRTGSMKPRPQGEDTGQTETC